MDKLSLEQKADYIDAILGFCLDKPFLAAAADFPHPGGEVAKWYRIARVFDAVFSAAQLTAEYKEIMFLLVEDAISEMTAAEFIGDQPDTEQELGCGYDNYNIPAGFEEKWHGLIWEKVLAEYQH